MKTRGVPSGTGTALILSLGCRPFPGGFKFAEDLEVLYTEFACS